jgi:hypothetical protein
VKLTLVFKDSPTGHSPTLWRTDDGDLVVQGYKLDAETKASIGIPEEEDAVRVPAWLVTRGITRLDEPGA